MNSFTSRRASLSLSWFPLSFSDCTLSLARASLSTETRGPFPDRNTLYISLLLSICCVAMFSPTSVLPDPGTPVMKQIDFCLLSCEYLIILDISSDVSLKFLAPASLWEISFTECPLYKAIAASIIVGVGL